MKQLANSLLLDKVFLILIAVVFGGIVLHAPFIVAMETLWPDHGLLVKSWKEILLLLAAIAGVALIARDKKWSLFRRPVVLIALAYSLFHIIMIPLQWSGPLQTIAGLMIDLRYVLFFLLVYLAVELYPAWRALFLKIAIAGAVVVVTFAMLQVFILPPDVLSYIGYDDGTIVPYLTVDQNPDYIRINSTLRGPNSVGAYAVIVLALTAAAVFIKKRTAWTRGPVFLRTVLVFGGIVALWASYSRSAMLAAILALGLVVGLTIGRQLSRRTWISIAVVVVAIAGILLVARDSHFVSNVILHENPVGGSAVSSNDGHLESLQDGTQRLVTQPLGAGIGSTGSASLLGDAPLIIENQYLYIAHEVGWIGLLLFVVLFVYIMKLLWRRRSEWLALGVFASGIGLAFIGLLLPVWVDDTIGIIWWGLAALAIGGKSRG